MSIYRMNKILLMKFTKLYRDKECLWNIESPNYKNREARNKALKKISEEMAIQGFGPREVAQKIKNLRSTYNQEIKKIENSKTSMLSEDVYKPKVPWFETMHEMFLKLNTLETSATGNNPGAESHLQIGRNLTDDNSVCELDLIHKFDSQKQGIIDDSSAVKKEFLEISLPEEETDFVNFSSNEVQNCTEHEETSINQTINKLERIAELVRPSTENLHEYDYFANYVASALKSLPPENAISVQTEIMQVIANEKRKVLAGVNNMELKINMY
ncbi:uncharacterized protein LOC142318318 [Lycorma delicatula]|uniref:uncharacterized protein LOC142318318 n=1 Tax=Lycorma delicatula TaxID=130591 RepID=UPI003F50F006